MIKINYLKKKYHNFLLDIKHFEIKEGDHIALVGNNGSGKTTLLKLILDLIKRNSGHVYIDNKDVTSYTEWKNRVNSYLNEDFLIDFLTPKEFIDFILKFYNNATNCCNLELNDKLLHFFNYYDENKLIRNQSKGNKLKIGIIASIITTPKILILDEPFSSLDPSSRNQLIDIIEFLFKKKTITTIISSHDINEVIEISNKIVLLENGKIIKNQEITNETKNELEEYFKTI